MSPQRKKIITITGISLGILALSFLLPAFVFPTVHTMQKSASCMDFNCAGTVYQSCETRGGTNSSGFFAMATGGINGLACMLGLGHPASELAYLYAADEHGTFKSKITSND